ncbi:MAG: SCO family protein [Azoarcus sp.]|nr:SCO family protein [Azoarcus sp.]
MNESGGSRGWWWVLLVLVLAACGKQAEFVGTDISGAKFGDPLALADHHGNPRKLADFEGKVVALFFGYTHCPDVCPTTLDDLAKALRLLESDREQVQVLFVTLDPERDTQEVLAHYVPSFDASFIGLYGDVATTEQVAKNFKVYYRKEPDGKGGYTIDHSAGVYVFDKKGALRVFINHGQKPQDIAHDLKQLM